METYPNPLHISHAPTETADLYPESDGKPMADTDLHTLAIIKLRQILENYLAQRLDAYVSGNLMMYDVEGPGRTAVSPDILVSFGVGKKNRRTYKVWEEGKPPDFVMEFASRRTFRNDLTEKMSLYASMGISEYFLYDVDRRYLPSPLIGFRLVGGTYVEIPRNVDGSISSATLGGSFHLLDEGLGIYDTAADRWLQTPAEIATERAEHAEQRVKQEAAARQREAAARQQAEAEASRLREELARLKARL